MVSERAGVTYTDNNLSDMFNALMKYERKYILTETHNISAKILHKIERENKQYKIWRNENEQGTINTGSQENTAESETGIADKSILDRKTNKPQTISRELRTQTDGVDERATAGEVSTAVTGGRSVSDISRSSSGSEMLNDPEIKAMDWLERSKVITLQSDLIDQQIMREIVLIPR